MNRLIRMAYIVVDVFTGTLRKVIAEYHRIVAPAVFLAIYSGMRSWLPPILPTSEIDKAMELLAQVLAVVIGVLLIGMSVSISSYSGADMLSSLHSSLNENSRELYAHFFPSGQKRGQLQTKRIRNKFIQRPGINTLLFRQYTSRGEEGWFVFRPYWDGVWYQVYRSPFADYDLTDARMAQVQLLHEAVLNANIVLQVIRRLRANRGLTIRHGSGTNGTNWFLERLRYCKTARSGLPKELILTAGADLIGLALESKHYMNEEFTKYGRSGGWSPFHFTTFLLAYLEYMHSLCYLIRKLQMLRWALLWERFPSGCSFESAWPRKALFIHVIDEAQNGLAELRNRIVSAHSSAKYFHEVKIWSVPGIGLSFLALVGVLCIWPYLKWVESPHAQSQGFMILYSIGIASLAESAVFLVHLISGRGSVAS
jgi:hypothetical protein